LERNSLSKDANVYTAIRYMGIKVNGNNFQSIIP